MTRLPASPDPAAPGIPSAHLAADPVLPAPGSAGESPGPYAAHAGAAAGRGPTAPGAAVAAEAGQPSATVHASAVPGHSTPGVGANAVPAPSPGSTQTSAETFRKRYSAAGPARLTSALAGDFAQLFTAACWEASAQRALMDESSRA